MHISSLNLSHFRNYSRLNTEFHPHFNWLVGKNGQGKTNLVEALYYLSCLSSFRSSQKDNLIHKGCEDATLSCSLNRAEGSYELKITLGETRRILQVNGKKPSFLRDYYGILPLLLFEPRDVYLFRGSPADRRRFINRAVFLQNPEFATILKEYDTILSHKNRLLKEGGVFALPDQLPIWNEKLAQTGAQIMFARLQWLKAISKLVAEGYQNIAGRTEDLVFDYHSKICGSIDVTGEALAANLKSALVEYEKIEILRREAIIGPHRDDLIARLNGESLGQIGSQGENRSVLIAIKSSQVQLFYQKNKIPPIFILDDVASELDQNRLEALFAYLKTTEGQVFLTSTQPLAESYKMGTSGRSFMVEEGHVRVLG